MYDGDWARDKMNGQGVMLFPNGSTVKGEFKDDKYMQSPGDGLAAAACSSSKSSILNIQPSARSKNASRHS